MATKIRRLIASCTCGSVEFVASGEPLVSLKCYCQSCQAAGRQFEALPSAPKVLDSDGGTPFVLYRKDKVTCINGSNRLENRKLMLVSCLRSSPSNF